MNGALMLHRHARPAVAGSFIAGSLCGAALTATSLLLLSGLLSPIPREWRAIAALVAIGLLALRESGLVHLNLPQRAYQIPQNVFHDDPRRAAFRFAFELGTGVRTYITSSAPYAAALTLLLIAPNGLGSAVSAASLLALGYGVGRSLIVGLQPLGSRVAVDHPRVWLQAAGWVSLASCAWLAVEALGLT